MELTGIHHLTAISSQIRNNKEFYTSTLGMRLVKRSVNQDDVSAWHLFYADARGTPGTDLTFFDWPVEREKRGNRAITGTSLRVPLTSFSYWEAWFKDQGVSFRPPENRDGRQTLDLEDPEGQRLHLIADDGTPGGQPWKASPVPAEHQILGLGPIHLTVPDLAPTQRVLDRLGMRAVRDYQGLGEGKVRTHVFAMGPGGVGAELHVTIDPRDNPARQGAGGVHHVAFRINDSDYEAWSEALNSWGIRNSGPVDRHWFRSLYFREPNGILFELATDGPGFAVDEDPDHLGEKIVLAPFLEPHRAAIEAGLTPLE